MNVYQIKLNYKSNSLTCEQVKGELKGGKENLLKEVGNIRSAVTLAVIKGEIELTLIADVLAKSMEEALKVFSSKSCRVDVFHLMKQALNKSGIDFFYIVGDASDVESMYNKKSVQKS